MVHLMLFHVLNDLYFYVTILRHYCAVPNTAVFCSPIIIIIIQGNAE